MLAIPVFAYRPNLCGCVTDHSIGPVIIYFGLAYVPYRYLSVGVLVFLFHLLVWYRVGLPWRKLLGWW